MKKTYLILTIILLLICLVIPVNASGSAPTLEMVQKSSEIAYLEDNQGNFTKTITDINSETGEITIELKLSNLKGIKDEKTEIIFVIDNSDSMQAIVSGSNNRKDVVVDSTNKLITNIFKNTDSVSFGIAEFSSLAGNTSATRWVCNLTNNKEDLFIGLNAVKSMGTKGGTNITDALLTGNSKFTKSADNKILILLTDGSPSERADDTKQTLLDVQASGTYIVTMMTSIDNSSLVTNIFGTPQNPTAGAFYYTNDDSINDVLTNGILGTLMNKLQKPINTITLNDYFPEEIVENFDFSYDKSTSIGTVTKNINETTRNITWNMDILKGNETASLFYKLKIKDINNKDLINKILPTNEKVTIVYKDINGKDHETTVTDTPKIKLKSDLVVDNTTNNNTDNKVVSKPDNTISNSILPKVGATNIIISIVSISILVGIALTINHFKYKDVK